MRNDPFDLTATPALIGRIVTATVALVCLLIVYDGWADLKPLDVVFVIVGPVVAICTTHIFSNTLVQLVALGRRPTIKEWLVTVRFESRFLLLAVPPLAVLLVLHLANVALTDGIQVVIWLEALSLSFWAGLAAWYAGLRGRLLALSILAGLVISGMVLLLQVILQPGKGAVKRAAPSFHLPLDIPRANSWRRTAVKEPWIGVDNKRVDQASRAYDSLDGRRPFGERAAWTYVFTICEYGGGEMASCRLTCGEDFADGFERGLKMRIDDDTHYIVREEIGEGDVADRVATLEPWIETA